MADAATSSLIVACLALFGVVLSSSLTAWQNIYLERMKHHNTFQNTVSKYRDPLHHAAADLSSKLVNVVDQGFVGLTGIRDDYVVKHTCFVFGQYLSWVHILKKELQFLHPLSDMDNIYTTIDDIRQTLRSDGYSSSYTASFMIWTGEQQAIGELMTVEGKDGQMRCMGYASFVQEWDKADDSKSQLKKWFSSIEEAIRQWGVQNHDQRRLVHLQHLLVQLIEQLEVKKFYRSGDETVRIQSDNRYCPCWHCQEERNK